MKDAWACDFETYPSSTETWVWIWGACSIDDPDCFTWNNTIESFLEWALNHKTLYFHNLRFDGSFIVDHILKNGWEHIYGKSKMRPGQFSTVISKDNKWYSLTLQSKHGQTRIYDSFKKLPFSLARIAKAFDLGVIKGDIDYTLLRYPGHIPSEDELDYLKRDCTILARALAIQLERGLTKITIGSDALASYKKMMGKYYKYYFPYVDEIVDTFIRKSYKGGYVYLLKPGVHDETICFDINSLYPYAMTMPMPYGEGVYFEGEYMQSESYPLYVISFVADFTVKKGYLPTIQLKGNRFHAATEYVTDSKGKQPITLTSVDYEIFKRHYDIHDITFKCGYMYRSKTGLFDEYINYWMHIKETSTGALRELAKLMLNNLYGKFAKNPDVTQKIPILDGDKIKMILGPKEEGKTVYIPGGVFVTANARSVTINACQANYDRFIYCDTDSMHLIGSEPPDIDIHATRLGAWKLEYVSSKSKFLKAKRYLVSPVPPTGKQRCDDELKVTCAGMPDSVKKQVDFDNFRSGAIFNGKLTPILVPGGTYLRDTTFEFR